ncbi:MAG: phasin family protein [Paracoccaceae bacterium]
MSEELSRYVEIEEQHFLPMLRKHPDTKTVAVDALKGNKDLRTSLDKLSAMPKDTDAFLAELDVLKKNFQAHVRNERKELLPAVLKAFSDEEAGDLATTIEDAVAEADKAKRAMKREETAQAKREEEGAEQAEAAKRSAVRAQKVAKRAVREASEDTAETVARSAAKVQDVARDVTARVKDTAQKAVADTHDAMEVYTQTSQKLRDDAQAIKASSTVSAGAVSEIYSAWTGWFGNAARIHAEAAQNLMQCRTLQEVAEQQRAYATSAMRNWMEGNVEILKIAQSSSKQAIGPLSGRLNDAA